MDLPRYILLKSNANDKYLCFTKEKATNGSSLRFLEVNDESSISENIGFHHIKLEVEKSKTMEGLVHIRSCYNNKYLVRKGREKKLIGAEAHDAEEDESKWNCTLFKPIFVDDTLEEAKPPLGESRKIRLLHVSESGKHYVGASSDEKQLVVLESEGIGNEDDVDDFTVTDVVATAILPSFATFMGPNNKYVRKIADGFACYGNEAGERTVSQIIDTKGVVPEPVTIHITDTGDNWHYVSSTYHILSTKATATFFAPIKAEGYVALKSVDNGKFVNCQDPGSGYLILYPNAATLTVQGSLFRVGEPVVLRKITDLTYDLDNARIYNVANVDMYQDSRSNATSTDQTGSFTVKYTKSTKKAWTDSRTVNQATKFNFTVGIPKIGDLGNIEIENGSSNTTEWGEEKTDEVGVEYVQSLTIKAGKKVTLKVVASRGYCDVPFTCQVHDTMTNGNQRDYTKTDGLFVGCNEYSFDTHISEEDLSSDIN